MRVVVLCVVLAVPLAAWCEPPRPEDVDVLTIDQAVALALAGNAQVENAELAVEKAEHAVGAARTRRLPTVDIEVLGAQQLTPVDFTIKRGDLGTYPSTGPIPATDTKIGTAGLTAVLSANVIQPVSQLVRVEYGIRALQTGEQIAQERLRGDRQSTVHEVKRAYYELLATESALAGAVEAVAFYRDLARVVARHVAAETALAGENLDVQARLLRAESDQLALADSVRAQKERLNAMMGRNIDVDFRPVPPVEPAAPPADADGALAQRPDVAEARLALTQAEYDVSMKRAEYIPDLSLVFNYLSPQGFEVLPTDIVYVGLAFQWEPFDWGRKHHELLEKAATVDQARNAMRAAERAARVEVRSSERNVVTARARVAAADRLVEAAHERLRVSHNRYLHNSALLKDVLEAQSALADAERTRREALAALWVASADLAKATGKE